MELNLQIFHDGKLTKLQLTLFKGQKTMEKSKKYYSITVDPRLQFDCNEGVMEVEHYGDGRTRVVIRGLNSGEVNGPDRIASDVTVKTDDFNEYILPHLKDCGYKVQ